MLTAAEIWKAFQEVMDPEIPVLSIVELGIVRDVAIENEEVTVTITPTYSGCPAIRVIEESILEALRKTGVHKASLKTVFSPPWTTDWITADARAKLKAAGFSPPQGDSADTIVPFGKLGRKIPCPHCDSLNTTCTSEFGATACKALYVCNDCREPFEYFKDF